MSVKRAVAVCSLDVELDILRGPLPPEDTVGTWTYLKQCHKLFQLFNNSSEVDPESYKQLISIMVCFDTWYKEVKQKGLQLTNSLKDHWKQFLPRITYKDLKRTIRALLGVFQYVQMHHPEIHIIANITCQDDVEKLLFITTSQDIKGKTNHTTIINIFWVICLPRNWTFSVLRNERFTRKFWLLCPILFHFHNQNKSSYLAKKTKLFTVKKKVGNHLLIS